MKRHYLRLRSVVAVAVVVVENAAYREVRLWLKGFEPVSTRLMTGHPSKHRTSCSNWFRRKQTFWKSCIERVESTDFEGKKNILKIMYQTSCIDWIWVGKTDLSKNIANNLKWYERAVVQKKNAFN